MAPLWVFTPPVAAIMAVSASMPRVRNVTASSREPSSRAASAAMRSKKGLSAAADSLKWLMSMSVWVPGPKRSTRPGLGPASASRSKARTASAAVRIAKDCTGRGCVDTGDSGQVSTIDAVIFYTALFALSFLSALLAKGQTMENTDMAISATVMGEP